MAGNTKFMGFGKDGMVKLERWGGEALIEVSKESVKALRQACYDGLPEAPPLHRHKLPRIDYDETTGTVVVALDPSDASFIADVLETGILKGDSLYKQSPIEVATVVSREIRGAVQAHKEYISTDGEPGVDSERSN